MGVFDELQSRGLIAQMTFNEEKSGICSTMKKLRFYVGFDPPADSLHLYHFYVKFKVMAHMQQAGLRQ